MTKFSKVDLDITKYKPKMKPFYIGNPDDLKSIPFTPNTTIQSKADGEFSYIHVDQTEAYAINRFGRKTEGLPALKQLHMQFLKRPDEEADLLGELYAVDKNGKPLTLPQFVHVLKGGDESQHNRIHIGLFDLIKVTAERYLDDIDTTIYARHFDSATRFQMMSRWNTQLVHVLPWKKPSNFAEMQKFYEQAIIDGWEGIVVRDNGNTYKAKPNRDIDAVVIGINKNTKGFEKGIAKSVKVALMPDEGSYVELGDATIANVAEAQAMFELTRVKTNEDNNTVFVKPLVIVQINYISLFAETTNKIYKLYLGGFMEHGTMTAVRMKSPRVVGYRKDKQANTTDVGMNQIVE